MPTCWPSCVPDWRPKPQRSGGRRPRGEYGSSRLRHQANALSVFALWIADISIGSLNVCFGGIAVGGTDGQASNLFGLIRETGEVASGNDARSQRHRACGTLDEIGRAHV